MLGLEEKERKRKAVEQIAKEYLTQAVVPPMRERLGDPNRMAIPLTYPGKRKHLEILDSEDAEILELLIHSRRGWRENTG
jgi:hypothetical protein